MSATVTIDVGPGPAYAFDVDQAVALQLIALNDVDGLERVLAAGVLDELSTAEDRVATLRQVAPAPADPPAPGPAPRLAQLAAEAGAVARAMPHFTGGGRVGVLSKVNPMAVGAGMLPAAYFAQTDLAPDRDPGWLGDPPAESRDADVEQEGAEHQHPDADEMSPADEADFIASVAGDDDPPNPEPLLVDEQGPAPRAPAPAPTPARATPAPTPPGAQIPLRERLVAVLADVDEPIGVVELMTRCSAGKHGVIDALRKLRDSGRVVTTGKGKRNDPLLYSLARSTPPEPRPKPTPRRAANGDPVGGRLPDGRGTVQGAILNAMLLNDYTVPALARRIGVDEQHVADAMDRLLADGDVEVLVKARGGQPAVYRRGAL